MRYFRQRNRYSCGPIAILNALRWANLPITYKTHYQQIKSLIKCSIDGTEQHNLDNGLNKFNKYFDIKFSKKVRIREIDKHLKNGGSIILTYYYKDENAFTGYMGHFAFIVEENDGVYSIVNNVIGRDTVCYYNREDLKDILKYRYFPATCWFLSRRK